MHEIVKTEAIVLDVRAWSKTSHVVDFLAPGGVFTVLAKGAERSKSAFLGQYDMYYTCEVAFYAHGSLHALREISPLALRENLRGRWRENLLAGYVSAFCKALAPAFGPAAGGARAWYDWLEGVLDDFSVSKPLSSREALVRLCALELALLDLAGLRPNLPAVPVGAEWVEYSLAAERTLRISSGALALLKSLQSSPRSLSCQIADGALAAALRFIGVFAKWHLDFPGVARRQLIDTLTGI